MKQEIKRFIKSMIFVCCIIFCCSVNGNNTQAAVAIKKVTIKSVENIDTTSQKVKWKKVKGIKGYQIYYKTSGGKFKKLATVDGSKKSYRVTKLETNKKYIYKIRAYKRKSGKKYYGKFSEQVGKKTTNYLMELVKPYNTDWQGYTEYTGASTVSLGGHQYTNGFGVCGGASAFFNLGGKYSKISFTAGVRDGNSGGSLAIISDDSTVKVLELKENDLPKNYTVDIENATKLEFRGEDAFWNSLTLVNIKVYK